MYSCALLLKSVYLSFTNPKLKTNVVPRSSSYYFVVAHSTNFCRVFFINDTMTAKSGKSVVSDERINKERWWLFKCPDGISLF